MAARDESQADIDATVESILRSDYTGRIEVIVVDDASKIPIPEMPACKVIRLDKPVGCSAARKVGIDAATGRYICIVDPHMRIGVPVIGRLMAICRDTGGWSYAACNGRRSCSMTLDADGTIGMHWDGRPGETGVVKSTGMMGACYMAAKDVIDRVGWVNLPAERGHCELAQSLRAHQHKIPIHVDLDLTDSNYHRFRDGNTVPVKMDVANYHYNEVVAVYLSTRASWERWASTLVRRSKGRIRAELIKRVSQEYGEQRLEAQQEFVCQDDNEWIKEIEDASKLRNAHVRPRNTFKGHGGVLLDAGRATTRSATDNLKRQPPTGNVRRRILI